VTEQTTDRLLDRLRADRALTVVRAERIPDAVELCEALAAGGLGLVELTLTTADALGHVGKAAAAGLPIGVGTVMTAEQARGAVEAGATFLVTPGLRPAVARVATDAGIPVFLGAFTPTEVAEAVDLGAAAVKIFPAGALGPGYFKDLRGPFPDVALIPSGGVNAGNAADFLARGAVAVSAGTGVVPPELVAAGNWPEIASRAAIFVKSLNRKASS
jgi:2-dehydro-3-deoxyphosphogluconate aldolase / (4S)-4-hydroxy-2-oxoglutarate aldolase